MATALSAALLFALSLNAASGAATPAYIKDGVLVAGASVAFSGPWRTLTPPDSGAAQLFCGTTNSGDQNDLLQLGALPVTAGDFVLHARMRMLGGAEMPVSPDATQASGLQFHVQGEDTVRFLGLANVFVQGSPPHLLLQNRHPDCCTHTLQPTPDAVLSDTLFNFTVTRSGSTLSFTINGEGVTLPPCSTSAVPCLGSQGVLDRLAFVPQRYVL